MIKCLIYCTKDKNNKLIRYYGDKHTLITKKNTIMPNPDFYLNGKIVAQFDCEKVDIIEAVERKNDKPFYLGYGNVNYHWGLEDTCLSYEQLNLYLENKKGYAIHISNLEIFDKPKELSDYCVIDNNVEASSEYRKTQYGYYGELIEKKVFRAPQNMQVVFENGILTNHPCNFPRYKYVLISIRPEWVEKILNGEKTIEVRKSIVNKLKELI